MFDDETARRDLDRYRRRGPGAATKRLLEALRDAGRSFGTLLDIGGGVGTIAHEFLERGASHATLVESSPAYLAAAREESERRHTSASLEIRSGDLVEMSSDIAPADVVTLDKVVCCYPDLESLIASSAAHARHLYGIVYPRDGWWVRLAITIENRVRQLRGHTFRGFVHSNSRIDAGLRRAGLALRTQSRGAWWVIAVYERC